MGRTGPRADRLNLETANGREKTRMILWKKDPGGRAVAPPAAGSARCLQSMSTPGRSRRDRPTARIKSEIENWLRVSLPFSPWLPCFDRRLRSRLLHHHQATQRTHKVKPVLFSLSALLLATQAPLQSAEPPLPVTRGEPIVLEDFSKPDAVKTWRWGAGKWTVADGVLKGTETAERKHAAGIACQRTYHDAVISFRFQFAGGDPAILLLRNKFGNLCRVIISHSRMTLQKDRPNLPKDTREKTVVLGQAPLKLEEGQWYSVTAVVKGEEFAVTLHDHATLKGSHPAIDVDKMEIEFLAGGDSVLFDDLQAWAVVAQK